MHTRNALFSGNLLATFGNFSATKIGFRGLHSMTLFSKYYKEKLHNTVTGCNLVRAILTKIADRQYL
nr:MAG TPA: hypothetical protein [Caudoviricetes sp.]